MFAARRTFAVATTFRLNSMQLVTPAQRAFASPLDKKEKAEEKAYFSKKDAKLMKALLEKMEAKGEMPAASEHHAVICEDLDHIFSEHKLNKDGDHKLLYQELLEWKRHDH